MALGLRYSSGLPQLAPLVDCLKLGNAQTKRLMLGQHTADQFAMIVNTLPPIKIPLP